MGKIVLLFYFIFVLCMLVFGLHVCLCHMYEVPKDVRRH